MKGTKILLTLLAIVLLVAVFYFISNTISKTTGNVISDSYQKNQVDDCLEQQDITLYINSNSVEETLNELQLSHELAYVKIFNCLENPQVCNDKNIESFPTWIINENKIDRDISLSELTQYSGC